MSLSPRTLTASSDNFQLSNTVWYELADGLLEKKASLSELRKKQLKTLDERLATQQDHKDFKRICKEKTVTAKALPKNTIQNVFIKTLPPKGGLRRILYQVWGQMVIKEEKKPEIL